MSIAVFGCLRVSFLAAHAPPVRSIISFSDDVSCALVRHFSVLLDRSVSLPAIVPHFTTSLSLSPYREVSIHTWIPRVCAPFVASAHVQQQ